MNSYDKADPKPDGMFFNLLGIAFAVSITVAAAMSVWLPPMAMDQGDLSQLARSER